MRRFSFWERCAFVNKVHFSQRKAMSIIARDDVPCDYDGDDDDDDDDGRDCVGVHTDNCQYQHQHVYCRP